MANFPRFENDAPRPARCAAAGRRRTWPGARACRGRGSARSRPAGSIPSAAAALALAAALECRVEDLFRLRGPGPRRPPGPGRPGASPAGTGRPRSGGGRGSTPPRRPPLGVVPHDGVYRDGVVPEERGGTTRRTLVMACCDPAVGLLAAELARTAGRAAASPCRAPAATALALLGQGLVHAAGVHLTRADEPERQRGDRPDRARAGISACSASPAGRRGSPSRPASSSRRSGRRCARTSAGSAARTAPGRGNASTSCWTAGRPPRRLASDHRGVAEAVRSGWADAGVCLRLVSEEAGLDFLGVREEAYDLCFPERRGDDPRIQALLDVVRSPSYRRRWASCPGTTARRPASFMRVI